MNKFVYNILRDNKINCNNKMFKNNTDIRLKSYLLRLLSLNKKMDLNVQLILLYFE